MTIPTVALFNILACLGWSSVNVIVGAQLLAAINPGPHALPGWAGILIIALSTLFITTFGYRFVHAYERWSWIPVLVIFCIVAGEFGASGKFNSLLPLSGGKSEAGLVLSFAASVFGFATGWTSMAADYVRIFFRYNFHPFKRSLLVCILCFGGVARFQVLRLAMAALWSFSPHTFYGSISSVS